ncbi:NADPH oxidase 5-like isoform X2 [Gigantopelta aegis]|nr:NADPH oxidase 5-like isoform X2 [Gigantopelta aegis]
MMDKDASGKLEVTELIASLRRLTLTGSPDDKLQFLFDVYDVDGSGSITIDEVKTVLSSCMVESSLRLSKEHLDSLTAAIFYEMDLDHSGGISYGELRTVMQKHPEIMGNLCLSASQWLKRPQKSPAKASICKKYLSKSFLLNNLSMVVVVLVYVSVNIALFVVGSWIYRTHNWYLVTARGCGMCLNFNCCLVLLLMMRLTLTFLRTTFLAHVLPLDENIQLHKWVGVAILLFAAGHSLAHIGNAVVVADSPRFNLTVAEFLLTTKARIGWVAGSASITGFMMVLLLGVMMAGSLPVIRRKGYFQVFYWLHKLYIVFWILLILHAKDFYKYFIGPAFLYCLELLASSQITKGIRFGNIYIQEFELLPSKVTQLVLSRPDNMSYKPGDYIFIKIPAVARFEWHPFTISSAPEVEDTFCLHIRSTGGWTQKVYEYFDKLNTESSSSNKDINKKQPSDKTEIINPAISCNKFVPVRAYIHGPYGTSTREIFEAEHAVLISTGIGVTPYAAILQSIMCRLKQAKALCPKCLHTWYDKPPKEYINLRKVDFIWINRDQKSFEWFMSLLNALEAEQAAVCDLMKLEMHMYMTSALSKSDVKGIFLQMALDYFHNKEKRDIITGLKTRTHPGRPSFNKLFKKISEENLGKVKVFFCGSPFVATQLKELCEKYDFDFCKEIF